MSEGASAASGASQGASGAAQGAGNAASNIGMTTGEMAGTAAPNVAVGTGGGVSDATAAQPSMWDSIGKAMTDYNKGASGGVGDAYQAARGGNYMQTAGYLGNKLQGMQGSSQAPPLIQLPQSQAPQRDDTYARLYARYRGAY